MGVRRWLPLGVFAAVLAVVALALFRPADRTVRSALVGKPLPALVLQPSVPGKPGIVTGRPGGARVVNVFASWCVPCAAEAPQLMALRRAGIAVEGVAVRDAPADTRAFLRRSGDPFAAVGNDASGRFQLALGSSGVPETFVIDREGRVAMQHVGPIMDDDVATVLAAVRDAG